MNREQTTILDCGHEAKANHPGFDTGYGEQLDGKRYCYACCAIRDRGEMKATGKATLYLVKNPDYNEHLGNIDFTPRYFVTNWPSSLKLHATAVRKGSHNIGRTRFDAWFNFEDGFIWHGVNIGYNDILRCKRTKVRWKGDSMK